MAPGGGTPCAICSGGMEAEQDCEFGIKCICICIGTGCEAEGRRVGSRARGGLVRAGDVRQRAFRDGCEFGMGVNAGTLRFSTGGADARSSGRPSTHLGCIHHVAVAGMHGIAGRRVSIMWWVRRVSLLVLHRLRNGLRHGLLMHWL